MAGLEPLEGQTCVSCFGAAAYGVADGREHPLHLVLAALVDRQLDATRPEAVRLRGAERPSSSSTPCSSAARVARVTIAFDVGDVDLVDLVAWMRKALRRLAVVRQSSAPVVSASSRPTGTTRAGWSTRSMTVRRLRGSLDVVITPAGLYRST